MIVEIFNHPNYKIDLENGNVYNPNGKLLKASKVYNGYLTVTVDGKRRKVHRMVLMSATKCDGNGLQVNHLDGNKENNSINNLEWCSPKENTQHAEKLGLRKHTPTKIRKDRVLSDEEVLIIKKLIREGKTTKEIQKVCPKANPKNVYAIKNNLSYKLVKDNTEVS